MIEIKPPTPLSKYRDFDGLKIFLAGSIEMGSAEDWQTKLIDALQEEDVLLLNPRRDEWDSSWGQSINNPYFKKQVTWELNGIEQSDIVVFYFDPATKSPITLMELGLAAGLEYGYQVIVCCPEGFWRKGNVDIMCKRYKLTLTEDFDTFVKKIKAAIVDLY